MHEHYKSIFYIIFHLFQDSSSTVCVEGRGYALYALLFSMGRSCDWGSRASLVASLQPHWHRNALFCGSWNGNSAYRKRRLSCGWICRYNGCIPFLSKQGERKLEILKDSHIGAFAAIMLMLYYLIFFGAFSELSEEKTIAVYAAGFFVSRCLSGVAVVSFPAAKSDGLLFLFASSAQERIVKAALYVQLFLSFCFMLVLDVETGAAVIATAVACFAYYRWRCDKELGGITGDTAGWFVTVCECAMVVSAAIVGKI